MSSISHISTLLGYKSHEAKAIIEGFTATIGPAMDKEPQPCKLFQEFSFYDFLLR